MPETPPFLLAPIAVDALVVSQSDLFNTLWSNSEKNYTGLSRFEAIEPPPFVRGSNRPRPGVTVHWSLPDALTKGRMKDKTLLFPFVPNRWLVLRSARKADAGGAPVKLEQPVKGWFLESDHLSSSGTNLYPSKDGTTFTRLGLRRDLDGNVTTPAATNDGAFLTALGGLPSPASRAAPIPGNDPAFAAYAVNVDNVLSCYDDLSDLALGESEDARLSYLVAGWYSDGTADPMEALARAGAAWTSQTEWLALMKEYSWSADEIPTVASPRASLPSMTICHGMVFDVNWTGTQSKSQPFTRGADSPFAGTPIEDRKDWRNPEFGSGPNADQLFADNPSPSLSDLPHIAIGNSTTDALAALVEYLAGKDDRSQLGKLFQAFEYNLLDHFNEPGGDVVLNQKIRQNWFVPIAGETSWEVVAPRNVPDPAKTGLPPDQPPLDPANITAILDKAGLSGDVETLNTV